jgi:hypothetical protein
MQEVAGSSPASSTSEEGLHVPGFRAVESRASGLPKVTPGASRRGGGEFADFPLALQRSTIRRNTPDQCVAC